MGWRIIVCWIVSFQVVVDLFELRRLSAEEAANHWAYQKPEPQVPPIVRDSQWAIGAIDRFIQASIENAGLKNSLDAIPTTLLRRLHFDLVGLPPSGDDVVSFLKHVERSGLNDAVQLEVDRLLGSSRFGERWGRHWLDVARFAESSGKEANITFPYAWRYRDYVIDCLNDDVPFERFLLEQIAGDLLPYDSDVQRARQLIATGFLAIGPKNLDEGNGIQFLADVIDEQIDAVSRAVMSSSIACARCHDHKSDPFSMEDYYALAGVFASTKTFFGTMVSPANRVGGDPLRLPSGAAVPILHPGISPTKVKELNAQLAALKKEQADGMAKVKQAIANKQDASEIFTLRDALRIFWQSGGIEGQLEKVDENGRPMPLALGVEDRDKPIDAPLLHAGDVSQPGSPVPRALPSVFPHTKRYVLPKERSGRVEFARWLTDIENPLTGRVLANRVWQKLMGSGLVATVDDFGVTGQPPSHPPLLDYMATRLVESGWSIKALIREIVLSRTYRQASNYDAMHFGVDPDNRLLWRKSKRPIDAEAIRDAMLVASGELETIRPTGSLVAKVIGDRPVSLIGLDARIPKDLDDSRHRSVYLPIMRDRLPDALELFDFAEPSLVVGARDSTNVPVQALYLMNAPFVPARAEAFARRLMRDSSQSEQQIRMAFQWSLSRLPDDVELLAAKAFLESWKGKSEAEQKAADGKSNAGLVRLCQSLFSTAEFRNLD